MNVGAFAVVTQVGGYKETLRTFDDYQGLALRRPVLAALLAFFLLSLIGIPFTGGFFGKFYVFTAALQAGHVWLAVIGLINSGVACFYYLRLLSSVYTKPEETTSATTRPDSYRQHSRGHRPYTRRRCHADARHSARPRPPPGQLRQLEPARNLRNSSPPRLRRQPAQPAPLSLPNR